MNRVSSAAVRLHFASRRGCRYPNGAGTRYFLEKTANGVLTVAAACGTVTIFVYLFAMG